MTRVAPYCRSASVFTRWHMRYLCALVICATIAGCYPTVYDYRRLEAPDAHRWRAFCLGAVGPPSVIQFPFHGVSISMDVDHGVWFALHLPEGMNAQLKDDLVRVRGDSSSGRIDAEHQVLPVSRDLIGVLRTHALSYAPDACPTDRAPGIITGSTTRGGDAWCAYGAVSEAEPPSLTRIPNDLDQGVVVLPSLMINGVEHPSPALPFKRTRSPALSPINC